jgi:SPP1 family predicted phage head-tail adaptor
VTGSGDMNRRATLQRATVTFDDFGGEVETWNTLAQAWVHRRDVSANESYRAQEVGGKLSIRFRIRYSSDVADLNPRDRVLYAGDVYNITGVREIKRNRWLEVDAAIQPDVQAVSS